MLNERMKFIHNGEDSPELRAIVQAKMETILPANNGGPIKAITHIDRVDEKDFNDYTPVGSIEFYQSVISRQGKNTPLPIDYPFELSLYLKRELYQGKFSDVVNGQWVKPYNTKEFEHFFYSDLDTDINDGVLPDTPVWISEPKSFVNEWRVYVMNNRIIGISQYDGLEENVDLNDNEIDEVESMINDWDGAPVSYCLDVGRFVDGTFALVEVNDAWATGYYKGTIKRIDYARWLHARWESLTNR